jgi:TatA/E family protein of Tat protein translocase
MFDVGGGELILIFIVILLLFGPKKIPEVMRSFGKGMRQFRQAQEDLKTQLRDISTDMERSTEIRTVQPTITFTPPAEGDGYEPVVTTNSAENLESYEQTDSFAPLFREQPSSAGNSSSETEAINPEPVVQPVPRTRPAVIASTAADVENTENTDPASST